MRRLRRILAVGGGVLAVALLAIGIAVALRRSAPSESAMSARAALIPAGSGVRLAARVTEPQSGGPFPLVVMPASWSATASEYDAVAQRLAQQGFAVVAYAQRGFRDSGGTIDFAGPNTRRDLSTVISWALAHASGDPRRVGVMGASYGGGIALLGAEHDPRIKAVVALSTWTDWGFTFLPHHTVAAALEALLSTARQTGHLDAELTRLLDRLRSDLPAAVKQIRAMSALRSPITDVAALNANGTAVMLANGFEDSLVAPSQLVTFFGRLTPPKRLELAPGDHLGPEAAGLQGYDDVPIDDGINWLIAHLDRPTTAGPASAVQLTDVTTQQQLQSAHWPGQYRTFRLGHPYRQGDIAASAAPWTATIKTGADSAADSGRKALGSAPYTPPKVSLSEVSSALSFDWGSAPVSRDTTVAGTPRLTLHVSSSAWRASFYVYLYDVGPLGDAQLMSVSPYTAASLSAKKPTTVRLTLEPIAWTLPVKHRLAILIDTVDPRYTSTAPTGATLTLSATRRAPATLRVPLGS